MLFSCCCLRLKIVRIMCSMPLITFCYSCADVVMVTSQKKFEELDNSGKPFILKFFSEVCSICSIIKKPFEEVSQDEAFKGIVFAEIDIESPTGNEIANRYNNTGLTIFGVPTFVCKKGKYTVDCTVGVESAARFEEDLRKKLKDYFGTIENLEIERLMGEEGLTKEEIKPEEISIEVEEELAVPAPEEKETPQTKGVGTQLWDWLVSFFSFFIKKLKELWTYIIDILRKLFGGK